MITAPTKHKGSPFIEAVASLKSLRNEDLAELEPHQVHEIIQAIYEAGKFIAPLREAIQQQRP
jgi:hypothetical protein